LKVFYSWQLDAKRNVNKDLIHGALSDAIDKLNGQFEVSEAERKSELIELDQDTQGILGSPPIAETIFGKIRVTDVFVADVSLVARGNNGKHHINSNVAIELGYLLGNRGYQPLIKIMNTAFGKPENLPFDLSDRRWPMTYELHESADKVEIQRVKKSLAKKLVPILKLHLEAAHNPISGTVEFTPTDYTFCDSAYWIRGEPIVEGDSARQTFRCDSDKLIAVRIIPKSKQLALNRAECDALIRKSAPMINSGGIYHRTNKWGAIAFDTTHQSNDIVSATQLFREREIWCFTEELIYFRKSEEDEIVEDGWLLGEYALMKYLPDGVATALELARNVGLSEFNGQIIASDLSGVSVPPLDRFRDERKPFYDPSIIYEFDNRNTLSAQDLAYEFTRKVYGEAGISLPTAEALER